MKTEKTLREVCAALSISRRTIQGYEKAGLVSPSGKNKYGYLLYDQKAQELYEKRKDINVYYDPKFTFNGKNEKASVIEAYLLSSIMNGDSDKKRVSLKEYATQNAVKYAEIKALKAL